MHLPARARRFARSWTQNAGMPPLECSVRFDELPVCVRVRMRVGVCGYLLHDRNVPNKLYKSCIRMERFARPCQPQNPKPGGGVRSGPGAARTILLFHTFSARTPKQPRMVRTFLKVHTRPRLEYALRCCLVQTRSERESVVYWYSI